MPVTKIKSKSKITVTKKVVKKNKVSEKPRSEVVREEILESKKQRDSGYLNLARLIYESYREGFYQEWGFSDFTDYCNKELDIEYRKAMYFVQIGEKLKSIALPADRLEKMGWTRVKDLVSIITPETKNEWLEKAEAANSAKDFTAMVQAAKGKKTIETGITTLKFKLSNEVAQIILEAIEESKEMLENPDPSIALEVICQEWLELKGVTPETITLEAQVKYLKKIYGEDTLKDYIVGKSASEEIKSSDKKEEVDVLSELGI